MLSVDPDPYKVVALNFLPLRVLQSEINSRLYSVKAAESPSQEWFDKMFERLKVWLSNSPEPRGCTSAEGYAISFHSKSESAFSCVGPSREVCDELAPRRHCAITVSAIAGLSASVQGCPGSMPFFLELYH